jgi:hypothetical protein
MRFHRKREMRSSYRPTEEKTNLPQSFTFGTVVIYPAWRLTSAIGFARL